MLKSNKLHTNLRKAKQKVKSSTTSYLGKKVFAKTMQHETGTQNTLLKYENANKEGYNKIIRKIETDPITWTV